MTCNNNIKVGILVSYDWQLLRYSLPLVYEEADLITLAIDRERRTWTGGTFELPKEFYCLVESIDIRKKIRLYEDSFFVPQITPMECETRERNMLAAEMGLDGWHVQLDADEYVLNFSRLVKRLKDLGENCGPVQINGLWLSLFKEVNGGYLVLAPATSGFEIFPFITNNPHYVKARNTNNQTIKVPEFAIHQSWARSYADIKEKLENWGHAGDFDRESYLNIWDAIDNKNYKYLANFHPIWPELWPRLEYLEAENIESLISEIRANEHFLISNSEYLQGA